MVQDGRISSDRNNEVSLH